MEEAMGEAGFKGIRKFAMRRQNMVAKYIVIRPVLDLCEWYNQRLGVRVPWWWWEQASFNLERAKKRAAEAETVLESESELESESDLESKLESEFESESKSDLESDSDS